MKKIITVFGVFDLAGVLALLVIIGMLIGLPIGVAQGSKAGNKDVRICEAMTGMECVLMAVPAMGVEK